MSNRYDRCLGCGQMGHVSASCPVKLPAPLCGRCAHADRDDVVHDMVPCTQNEFPLRAAKRYAAHSPCDKGAFTPRAKKPTPKKDDNHEQQPSLI